jgi:subtilase family serine protease
VLIVDLLILMNGAIDIADGTSAATPIFAGLIALLVW